MLAAAALGACQPALRPIAQAPTPVASPAGTAATAGVSTTRSTSPEVTQARPAAATTVAEPTDELLAKTVTAVFGDSSLTATAEEPSWDIDVRSYETHARVMHYVQLFSGTGRERFATRLSRGTRYEPMIRAKLRAAGLPEDLTFLALIESGYDPHAYSRAAAVGMWQFMTGTAKDVGMRVDWWMDERRDPARATDGAIRFLDYLQREFGSLYLAAAAYNGGPGRVARGLTRFADEMESAEGEDRFFALAEQDYLHAETKNYVPQLIAAALVAKEPGKYGVSIDTLPAYAYDSLLVEPGTSMGAVSSVSRATVAELRDLNPAILRGVTPPDASIWVRIPVGSAAEAREAMDAMPATARRGYSTVKSTGTQSLASLAKSAGITTTQLRWFNPAMKVSTKTGRPLAGQSLRIPDNDALAFARDVPDPKIEKYGTSAAKLGSSGIHVVRPGESLSVIGKRYGVSVATLKSLNRMKGDKVIAGQTLRVRSTAAVKSSKPAASTAKKPVAKKGTSTAKKPVAKKATPTKKPAATKS